MMMPIQAYKFKVVPIGREDMAAAFAANVASAEIDLVNKVFRVMVRQTRETITLSAVDSAVKNRWIPELHLDTGNGNDFEKLIRFDYVPSNEHQRHPVSHILRFDYANSGAAMHVIEWAFTSFSMEKMEAEPRPCAKPSRSSGGDNLPTPEEAMAKLDRVTTKPKP